jgi:hypothetical protein
MTRVKRERRHDPRWAVGVHGSRLAARITPIHEATLINISRGGALVEHSDPFPPGTISLLTLMLHEQKVGMKCRVVRTAAHRNNVVANGERELIYRTGLEFLGTLERVRAVHRMKSSIP